MLVRAITAPLLRRWCRGRRGAATACFPLSRALLGVRGAEAAVFLQGLLTNDVTQLVAEGDAPPALYAHALNVQGRCLYDVILYRLHGSTAEEPHILLECDSSVLDPIQKHLKLYKIRRKVTISPCPDLSLWAVIPGDASSLPKSADQALLLTPDPRAEVMGWRVIAKKGANLSEIIPGSQVGDIQDYHRHRHSRRGGRSPPRSRPPAGIQPGLHERHQLHQGLLHRPGADGQDAPHGRDPQAAAARPLPAAPARLRRPRGRRDPHRGGQASRQVPSWPGRAGAGPAEAGTRQGAALRAPARGHGEPQGQHAPVVATGCC
ncbi:putative transferase CAF17, mitochondrial isoform X2 [Oenanthe melanoleuca]|uniref:putative transferase CAF17, mitochondrial isoform X2 n=1 Tax=Oenanthe melanoleuca TaxID=2939378 RepID=UPI0024C10EF5|nr:putative transferase CAF17, mitochondrial isoform X2 [Oenanthe melanoleuca]